MSQFASPSHKTVRVGGGKANGALLKLLAKQWRIPKSSLSIVAGASSRRKTVLIEGDGEVLLQRLQEWIRSKNV